MDWVAKNKKTGEYITITTISSSSSGREISFLLKDGKLGTLEEKEFDKKYEVVDPDFSFVVPTIVEGAKADWELRNILAPLARKCTPDYYKPGNIVLLHRIDNGVSEYFGKFVGDNSDWYTNRNLLFVIIGIKEDYELGLYYLELDYFRGPGDLNPPNDRFPDIRVPLNLRRPFARDASRYLKRIDMPY